MASSPDRPGPKRTAARQTSQRGAPKQAAPRKAAAKGSAPKKAATKKAATKKAATKQAAPRKAAPRKAAPRKAAPRKAAAPRKPAPRKASAKKAPARKGAGRGPAAKRPGSKRTKPAKRRSFLWRWRRGFFAVGLLLVASMAGTGFVLAQIELPPARIPQLTSFICTSEVTEPESCSQDNATAVLYAEQNRVDVTLEEMPEVLVAAVLAAEDRDFFDHRGVDPTGIARAAYRDIRGDAVQQGGSTITQQYVKLVYLTTERTITRKIKEAVLAVKLEQELEKEEILERYLNLVYFGRGAYGVGTAARAYFGKDVSELDLAEAAYLAGLIRAPEAADATRDPETATFRRQTVLDAMLEEGMIDQAAHDAADAEPWVEGDTVLPRTERQGLGDVRGDEYGTTYFIEHVRQVLRDEYGFTDDQIYGGGLRIYTTLDHSAQQAAWNAVTSTLDRPDDPATPELEGDPNAAIVAIDDGYVRAMMGGRDFDANEFNYASGSGGAGRQPGSSMKPIVLATALQQGISLQSRFDSPGQLIIPRANAGEDWEVNNYGGTEQGVMSLVDATRVSSNTAYAQLVMEVGPDDVVALANRLGIDRQLDPYNSIVLGTEEVSPLEMTEAYSTFANGGEHVEPLVITRVEYPDGRVFVPPQPRERVLEEDVTAQLSYALRGVVERGTAQSARLGVPAAGKTGTTQDNLDAWFVGYLPNGMTAAVWMGYDPVEQPDGTLEPRFMDSVHGRSVTGGSFPAEMWHDFMTDWIDIAGGDVGSFPSVESFPGELLNDELEITTSTLPECGAPPEDAAGTTEACRPTTTVAETTTSSTAPASTSTTAPVNTTTTPPEETTTTAPAATTTTSTP
jgi:penicillin-binding protein 1A